MTSSAQEIEASNKWWAEDNIAQHILISHLSPTPCGLLPAANIITAPPSRYINFYFNTIVTIFPTLFLSYTIAHLHFFGHLFFILVLLIYDYSSTVCLLRRLFMHCPYAYSCAYSCTACLLMHSLTVQYIRTEWTLLFCS